MTSSTPAGVLSFRQSSRIDYSDPAVMRARHEAKQRQRSIGATGAYVVGRFGIIDGIVVLEAVPLQPGYYVDDSKPLTRALEQMARWRTRQGARQWMIDHPRPSCRIVNLEQLTDTCKRVPNLVELALHAPHVEPKGGRMLMKWQHRSRERRSELGLPIEQRPQEGEGDKHNQQIFDPVTHA